jgi:hypothetical protein
MQYSTGLQLTYFLITTAHLFLTSFGEAKYPKQRRHN